MDYKRKTAIMVHKRNFSSSERLTIMSKYRRTKWRRNEVQFRDRKNILRR